jgi:hypothetical protein
MTGEREAGGGSVICAECGAENRATRFFCSSCGAYLRREEDTWEGAVGDDRSSASAAQPAARPPARPHESAAARPEPRERPREEYEERRPVVGAEPPAFERHLGDPAPLVPPPLPTGIGLSTAHRSEERRRRQRALGVLLAFLLLLGLVFAVILVRSALRVPEDTQPVAVTTTTLDETTPTTPAEGAVDEEPPADEEEPETPAPVQVVEPVTPDEVTASSELQSQQENSYAATNVLDGDFDTSWQEGAQGDGPGEWLAFSFEEPLRLARIEIANGYQRDERRFQGNPRIERLRVEYDDGSSQLLLLEDEWDYQSFDLDPTETQELRLVIESVYPGELWEDASISAIRLFRLVEE